MGVRTPSIDRILLYFTELRTYSLDRISMKMRSLSVLTEVIILVMV